MKALALRIIVAFLMSVPLFHYVPDEMFDLHRHYERYDNYFHTGDDRYITEYVGLSFLMRLMNLGGLSAEFMACFSSFFLVLAMFKIGSYTATYSSSSRTLNLSLLVAWSLPFLVFQFFPLISGVRFALAISFFIFGALQDYKKGFLSKPFMLLAVSFHAGMLVMVILFYLSKLIKINKLINKVFVVFFAMILAVAISVYISSIGNVLVYLGVDKLTGINIGEYLSGTYGLGAQNNLPETGELSFFIAKITTYICILLFAICHPSRNKNDDFIFLASIFLIFTSTLVSISGRFESLVMYFMLIPVVINLKHTGKLYMYEWILIGTILVRFILDFWMFRHELFTIYIS